MQNWSKQTQSIFHWLLVKLNVVPPTVENVMQVREANVPKVECFAFNIVRNDLR